MGWRSKCEHDQALDFSGLDPLKDKLYKGVFKRSWYKVLSDIYDVIRSDIEQRERKRKRKRKTIISLTVSLIFATLFLLYLEGVLSRIRSTTSLKNAENLINYITFDLRNNLLANDNLDLLEEVDRNLKKLSDYHQSSASFSWCCGIGLVCAE